MSPSPDGLHVCMDLARERVALHYFQLYSPYTAHRLDVLLNSEHDVIRILLRVGGKPSPRDYDVMIDNNDVRNASVVPGPHNIHVTRENDTISVFCQLGPITAPSGMYVSIQQKHCE